MITLHNFVRGILLGAVLSAGQAAADPVGMGPDGPGQLITTHSCFGIDPVCKVATPTSGPVDISAHPEAPNWVKQFQFPGAVASGTEVHITEFLHVGQLGDPGLNWHDWHEVIVSEGWSWFGGTLLAGAQAFAGLVSADGQEIDFAKFDLPPSTQVEIEKDLACISPSGCQDLLIREWPTVPEPGSMLLLAAGLAGLGLARRRRT